MSFIQALLCGILYYLNAGPWIIGIGYYTFGKPVVLGFFVGLILGDVVTGTIVGATIQLIYLGLMSTGGSYPADAALAGIIGTVAAITTGLEATEAVAIAVPIGLIGTIFYQLRMVVGTFWAHLADKYVEKGQVNKIWIANILGPQICIGLIYIIPCTLACYYGVSSIQGLVDAFHGTRVLDILGVIGGMLPAIGIAMNMKAIFKGDARYFFFIGFLLVVYFNLDLIGVGFIAILFTILYMKLKSNNNKEEVDLR